MSERVTAETYLVLVPDTYSWSGKTHVRGIRVDRCRAAKPALKKGEIAIRLKLHFNEQQLIDAIPVVEANVTNFSIAQPEPEQIEILEETYVNN